MGNAETVWNQANEFTAALRHNRTRSSNSARTCQRRIQDYQSRLIEFLGILMPVTSASRFDLSAGYTGPDLYHYMYVDMSSYNSAVTPPTINVTAHYTPLSGQIPRCSLATFPKATRSATNNLPVQFSR